MIVDDSAVVRSLTRRWLEADSRIELAGICIDGAQAVAEAAAKNPDVIILDVEMPVMDGLTALPKLRTAAPQARIVMASTLTSSGAATTIRALQLGAADYIAKPDTSGIGTADSYHRELIAKVTALGERAIRAPGRRASVQLRKGSGPMAKPSALLVAASTGGPSALQQFLTPIARRIQQPILIVQHMPASFTGIFAEKLGQAIGKPCREACDGETLEMDLVLVAPGDQHMRIVKSANSHVVKLDRDAPVNYCRPAADPLFESAAAVFGPRVLGVVLTGMGHDGRDGSGRIVEAGGRVIVQDEASSVVWGMPGAVAQAGYAEAVKPLTDLSSLTLNLMNGVSA